MAHEFQDAVVALVADVAASDGVAVLAVETVAQMPPWLVRPGLIECGDRWPLVQAIYRELTGLELPDKMRSAEWRVVDAILTDAHGRRRVLEVDEKQHFNRYRAMTLRSYPADAAVAFDHRAWLAACDAKRSLEGGQFAKPKPPLFPGEGGRHRQRAFRDALCDLLPPEHGWLRTLRISKAEAQVWIGTTNGRDRMRRLLAERLT